MPNNPPFDSFTEEYVAVVVQQIINKRYFETERGYQGKLLALLESLLDGNRIFPAGTIIEQEYQKRFDSHDTRQRPDILIHVPRSYSHASARANNFLAIALKRNGTAQDALTDFFKLDELFEKLDYREGLFINVNRYPVCHLQHYVGRFKERINELSIRLEPDNTVSICHARFKGEELVYKNY